MMTKHWTVGMLALGLGGLVLAGCGKGEATQPGPGTEVAAKGPVNPASTGQAPGAEAGPAAPVANTAAKGKLLFFLNPNGRPCQIQDGILQELGTGLTSVAPIEYIAANDPAARDRFDAFGVRALPTLILVDTTGAEVHRFSPGIHPAGEITQALTMLR